MTYRKHVTAAALRQVLMHVPSATIIDIACDPEINQAGPLAMHETGELDVLQFKLREDGRPVLVLWPIEMACLEDRYEEI